MHVDCSQTENLDSANAGGWTPLMYASYIGHDVVVQQLIEAGASVNSVNNKGQSPLTLATSCGNDKTAELLIKVCTVLFSNFTLRWCHAMQCEINQSVSLFVQKCNRHWMNE